MIAVDIETYDPNLSSMGDGSIRKDGFIICIGLYDGDDFECVTPDDPRLVDWLASDEPKIFHNSIYDLSWLVCGYGFKVNGILHDTMTRQSLIDEYSDLSLDTCCKAMHVKGKNADDTIEKWFSDNAERFGFPKHGNIWDYGDVLWMSESGKEQMIKYNKQDCIATYNLFKAQEPRIASIQDVYKMECDLQPIILEMKKNGIRIDSVQRDRFTEQIQKEYNDAVQQLSYGYGITSETIASPKKMTIAMNQLGVYSPVSTATGSQSWSADALELIDHPSVELIQSTKNYKALLDKYLMGSFQKAVVNGRIHCTFSPNKREAGGTITGRFASSKPNMQNIPARDQKHGQKSYGQEMRQLFIPDEGHMIGAFDYSQIEYLLLAHYAVGAQADWFRQQANSGVDFHTAAQSVTGITVRDMVKRLNYGIIYGMGIKKMFSINRKLFGTLEHAQEIFNNYHRGLPVIRDTMTWVQNISQQQGYIKSIGGRIHHKPKPQFIDGKWNNMIYKMTNYLIQGSAAEVLKHGLLDAWNEGVFDILKLHITVHDENVVSIPYTKVGVEAAQALQHCMENSYKQQLLVPMKAVGEVGPNWGYWKDDIWQRMQAGDMSDGALVA